LRHPPTAAAAKEQQQQVFDQRQTNKSRQCTSWLGLGFQHLSVSLSRSRTARDQPVNH
jgi:hypothetical protein